MVDDSWVDRDAYPFQSRCFEVLPGRLHYVDEGRGRPVVMLHGNPTWSFLYRDLIRRLSPDYRCVAPDHLGFGLSAKPEDWTYLPEQHSANLDSLIEGLGLEQVVLVMQDWGGPIGLGYAAAHPGNIAGLVILNTWAWPVNRDPYYLAFSTLMGGALGRLLIRRYNFFARWVMRQAFADKGKLSSAAHAHYRRALAEPGARRACYVLPKQIIGSTPWLRRLWHDIEVLSEVPKLIVWGMRDVGFRRKEMHRWADRFPDARVVCLDDVGHFVQEEDPDRLAEAVMSFLKETVSG